MEKTSVASPPHTCLDAADHQGRPQRIFDLREVDLGDGLSIPFRLHFNTANPSSAHSRSPLSFCLLDASLVQLSPKL